MRQRQFGASQRQEFAQSQQFEDEVLHSQQFNVLRIQYWRNVMAPQAFEVVPPASCAFSLSRTKQLPFLHATPFYRSRLPLPKVVALQGTAGGPFETAKTHSSGRWSWNVQSMGKRWLVHHSSIRPPNCSAGNGIRWLALLLYRALLVGGIGLSLGHTAAVHAAPPVFEVITSVGKQKEAEKSPQEAEGKVVAGLGDEFWKGVDLERGSDELILKKILDTDPTNLSALECLAKTLMDDDDLSRALLVLEKLEELQPTELEWKYLKADVYDLIGKSELAKKIFEDILQLEPFSSRALQGLVLAMDRLDEGDSAMKILEDTWNRARGENNHEEAQNFGMLIGQVHTFKGRMQEALQHYKKMIEEDANDYRPFLCQGIIYSVLGELDKAEENFQISEKLCPKDLKQREAFDGLRSRARTEGQRINEFKERQKAKTGKKGEKKK
ncbi:hypothetical protein GOP47_0007774 [Adiantum capillus-veneris]|uniref:Uncharacterized protein n=1 Tax=Adiantum capillus-veneris TaxID=13818 RepID=A0A9D4ZMA5_ADICA|nr:hypothetical protein GOP47_0007774 [Adiantum capillus-veneris]